MPTVNAIYMGPHADVPVELKAIQSEWARKANAYGDVGAYVTGAKFVFQYKGVWYAMPPLSRWPGCGSWEPFVREIRDKLAAIGATNITYDWGRRNG
ncbi:hypothetical protein [Alicyclobacillus shizuokensis]|uniref:hypothetical protein n=1 Tax=Alicyclobacillus shizuokensis TaxID=392014 RepID=UPI000830FD7C|nr:hypothetical protein [Alicyclobacillus shizuokensis]